MSRYCVTLAASNLDQWALDFDGNLARIITSIEGARRAGARFRTGPELELTGYGCEDHFYEADTIFHSFQSLAQLLSGGHTDGILVDVGLPLLHRGVRYNCRALCLDGRVLLIRPKMSLADDGNYREGRWFTPWSESRGLETFVLPPVVAAVHGQQSAPIGVAILQLRDATLGVESCEELFTPMSPHIRAALSGVDVIANGSGSHHQLRKLNTRVELIRSATNKCGGVYMYSNQRGCDGGRLYFDGCSLIFANGECLAQGAQFGLSDVEVVIATVDLESGRSLRAARMSTGRQATADAALPIVTVDYFLGGENATSLAPTPSREVVYVSPEEEIARGPACWLWDYLRRTGAGGFFLPLSGGADSASTAAIVGVMCHLAFDFSSRDARVLADLRRIVRDEKYLPTSPAEIASHVLHTCYMGTVNSSYATRARAAAVASQIGAYHSSVEIDTMVQAVLWVFATFVSMRRLPRFGSRGGTVSEDLALQNLQARLRMVLAYFMAQLLPWLRGRGGGFLLVLGSANVDEALRGYMTKYDCSSADVNPIGGISKSDLRRFLLHAAVAYKYPALRSIVLAPPTAELRPYLEENPWGGDAEWTRERAFVLPAEGATAAVEPEALTEDLDDANAVGAEHSQLDEADMGMTYDELSWFGRLRKLHFCGPLSMYTMLLSAGGQWADLTPDVIAVKVKRFFRFYAINRHKMTTLTPAYHAENYSPDDNRFDLRPFLYPVDHLRQFASIDLDVERRKLAAAAGGAAAALAVKK